MPPPLWRCRHFSRLQAKFRKEELPQALHCPAARQPMRSQVPAVGMAHPVGHSERHCMVPRMRRIPRFPGSLELDSPGWANRSRRARSPSRSLVRMSARA
eukprot:9709316-Heterocapsa_arctica.AAC.1